MRDTLQGITVLVGTFAVLIVLARRRKGPSVMDTDDSELSEPARFMKRVMRVNNIFGWFSGAFIFAVLTVVFAMHGLWPVGVFTALVSVGLLFGGYRSVRPRHERQ